MSITGSLEALQRILYIQYPFQFQKDKIQALINSDSEVNVMTPAYATKLGLTTQKTSVRA